MQRYVLISVFGKHIYMDSFSSLKDAQKQMKEEMKQRVVLPEDVFAENVYEDGKAGFDSRSAYIKDGLNHESSSWQILEERPSVTIYCEQDCNNREIGPDGIGYCNAPGIAINNDGMCADYNNE